MKKRELARFIYHVSRANGTMRLHPDSASGEFFDKYLFQSDPFILSEITEHLSTIVPVDSEVLAGLEMGGIPIAAALSLRTNLPLALVRKEPKENGAKKLAEGADVRNRRVCIVEDIIGTGGQAIVRSNDLRQLGARVHSVLCVIEQDPKARIRLKKRGLELIALFTMKELEQSFSPVGERIAI